MKENYYDQSLNAQKLYRVYQSKYPRVLQYLEAEISYVRNHLQGSERILELGAGYGRIMKELAPFCKSIVGIDISEDNVKFGRVYLKEVGNAELIVMDAHRLRFEDTFDMVLCLQNGLSAMEIEPMGYIQEIVQLLSAGGKAFFSSYSPDFWEYRVAWFQEQAEKGLLGELDLEKTKDGVIICKDGFCSTTYSAKEMEMTGRASGYKYQVMEVDKSSIFLVVEKVMELDRR